MDSRRGPSLSTRHITSLIASLKLPPGRLSASILSFTKFFSLPLDSSFLGHIRQKALGGPVNADSPHLPGEGKIPAPQIREAQALAALASAAKGVELSPGALSSYAQALLHGNPPEESPAESSKKSLTKSLAEAAGTPPGEHLDHLEGRDSGVDTGGEKRGSRDRGGDPASQDTGNRDTGGNPHDSGKTGGRASGRVPDDAPPVREPALAAQGPLLSALNRLPGRDGSRWIVLPFSLEGLDMCLRILLVPILPGQDGRMGAYRAGQMGLDIDDGEGAWRFVFHPGDPGGGASSCPLSQVSLEFFRSPAPGKGWIRAMERELAEFMGLPAGSVHGKDLSSFAESRDWTLLSVNKEV